MKKRVLFFVSLLAVLFVFVHIAAAAPGVSATGGKTAAGKAANFVIMPGGSVTPDILTANNKVTADMPASSFLSAAKTRGGPPVAMVNGTLFNAYYDAKQPITFPDNCPLSAGMLMTGGRMIHSGYAVTLGYTLDGKWLIDKVGTSVKLYPQGKRESTLTGVNMFTESRAATIMYTPEIGLPVPISPGATVYVVRNGIAESPRTGLTSITVNNGTYALVFNENAWCIPPDPGTRVEIGYEFSPSRPEKEEDWKKVTMAVAAGPLLLRNGQNVVNDPGINSAFINSSKHQGVAQRTFIGVKPDNTLVIGEASTTHSDAANTLRAMGCVDALAVDGGASSFLYANGKTWQAAGRKLNNVIAFWPASSSANKLVATPNSAAVYVDGERQLFDAYTIQGRTYFKLRDIAYVLNQTEKQFAVGWNDLQNAISLTTGEEYTPQGTEMLRTGGTAKVPSPTSSKVYLDGKEVKLTAYNIGGNNYFQLRELGDALGFSVKWDDVQKVIYIETGEGED